MRILPFTQPRVGVSFTSRRVALVEARSRWRGVLVPRMESRTLPDGLVCPSPTEACVSDKGALAQELRALAWGAQRRVGAIPVAVSLPDRCVRLALLDLDVWPRRASERDVLLRWRIRQEYGLSGQALRIASRAFPLPAEEAVSAKPPPDASSQRTRVLVAFVQEETVGQLEAACLQAGLVPLCAGVASLLLFDFWRPTMRAAARSHQGAEPSTMFFLHRTEESFTLIAIDHAIPTLIRSKPLRVPSRLGGLLEATLRFYEERMPSQSHDGLAERSTRPVFVAGLNGTEPPDDDPMGAAVSLTAPPLLGPEAERTLGVSVVRLEAAARPVKWPTTAVPGSAWPALAGVVAGGGHP